MLNPGQCGYARQRFAEEAAGLRKVVSRARKLHARREHAVRAEAEVAALQLDEAAHQQASAGQQHQRQGHFGDDERAEHAVQSAAAAMTSTFAQRIVRGARRDECGHESEEDSGRQRDDHGEGDHRQIERHLVESRNQECDRPPEREGRDGTAPRPTARATPPAAAMARLSVSIWRTNRARLAPSAVRMPSSRSRAALRASSRFATLTQATSSTSATAPTSAKSAGRSSPTICSCR